MKDFRFIHQASNALSKVPAERRELAIQYVWATIRPTVATVTPVTDNSANANANANSAAQPNFPPQPEAAA